MLDDRAPVDREASKGGAGHGAQGGRFRLAVADVRSTIKGESLRLVLYRARAWLSEAGEVIILLRTLESVSVVDSGNLRMKELEASDLAALHELNRARQTTRFTPRFAADLADGYRGFIAYRDDEAVAYYWWIDPENAAAHRDLKWLGDSIALEPGDVYGSDFFVAEKWRDGRTATEMLSFVESSLSKLGHRRIWGYVETDNRPARWLYSMCGYQSGARLQTITRFGRRRIRSA
jgi:GNAT superfamily N-acetyltransferase